VTAVNSTGSVSQSVTVLVSEEQPFKMGVVTHFGQNKGNIEANLNLIQQMGASSIRDEVFWASVEHQKGQYAIPANAEQFVTASLARGLKPLLTLDYGNPFYDGGDKPISDAAVEGYAKYAEFVVSHFKGRVSSYEIWNEWNGSVGKTTPGTAETYVRLLKVVYPRLKAIDPNVVIIGGAVAGGGITDGWFKAMLDAGALSAADAISVHQYIFGSTGFNRTPERLVAKIGAIQNTLRSYNKGQDFPLYLTETGWPTTSGGISPNEAGDFNAETMFLVATTPYLKGLWWYDFEDDGTDPTNTEDNFGLVTAELTPKPGYLALSSVMRWTSGVQFLKRLTNSDSTIDGVYSQLPNGEQALAIWRVGSASAAVKITGVTGVQLLQNVSPVRISDPLVLELSEAPAWITGQTLTVQ
jgi:hypothetical protein